MATDDTSSKDDSELDADAAGTDGRDGDGKGDGRRTREVKARLEQEADRAREQLDDGIIDLLSWILDTETRARIYVYLRQHPNSTSDEIAEGTGLYPSTVRESLAELNDEGRVERSKRQNDGAGNNPFEYSAIAPSDLVAEMVEDVQGQLNTVFNLDRYLADLPGETENESTDCVTITVTDETDGVGDDSASGAGEESDDG